MTITDDWTVTIPPCPSWCSQPPYHGYIDQTGDGNPCRSHWGDESGNAWPAQFEVARADGIHLVEPLVTLSVCEGDQLTPAEARALAAELVQAANAIDQG